MVAELQVSREINFMMSLCVPVVYIYIRPSIATYIHIYVHVYTYMCVYWHMVGYDVS